MSSKFIHYSKSDFGQAMANAVYRHAPKKHIRQYSDKLTFNGFWRDGNKRNVCVWPNDGTWSDLKESSVNCKGNTKSFAKIIFNMDLPEFMQQYGNAAQVELSPQKEAKQFSAGYVGEIWTNILNRDKVRPNNVATWLSSTRQIPNVQQLLSGGFANLYPEDIELFDIFHKPLIRSRLELGRNIISPIRGTHNGKVENLFFRCIEEVSKSEKSRLLSNCGGWTSQSGSPRAFGHPHEILNFPRLILCEGMADYFAVECLLDACEKSIPIGVPGIASFDKWVSWLSLAKYQGQIIVLYQLDTDKNDHLEEYGTGQTAAVKTRKILLENGLSAHLFNWVYFIQSISNWKKAPKDIADIFLCTDANISTVSKIFNQTLKTSLEPLNGTI